MIRSCCGEVQNSNERIYRSVDRKIRSCCYEHPDDLEVSGGEVHSFKESLNLLVETHPFLLLSSLCFCFFFLAKQMKKMKELGAF